MDFDAIHLKDYNSTFLFFFERKFLRTKLIKVEIEWLYNNWHYSIYYSIAYVLIVLLSRQLMKRRQKVNLHRSLVAWNILHSIFSVLGAFRLVPPFVNMMNEKGLDYTICRAEYDYGIIGVWSSLFVTAKLFDLFDTAFVILRKQNLLFLHWYHHAASLIYSWYTFKELSSTGRFFSVMNISAHALMYPYYVCRSLGLKIPKIFMVSITTLQTLQMVVGVYVNTYALLKKNRGGYCRVTYENLYLSFFMYFTFFVLFLNFFINRYIKKSNESKLFIEKEQKQKNK